MTIQPHKYTACQTFYYRLSMFHANLINKHPSQEKIKTESKAIAELLTDHLNEAWVLEAFEEFYNKHAYYLGLMHEATIDALLKYAFAHLAQNSIQIGACLLNDACQRVLKQCGEDSAIAIDILERLKGIYEKNNLQEQYEESLLSLYFVYKNLYPDEHPNTKEAKSKFVNYSKDWSDVTEKYKIFNKAESIAMHLPEAQRLGIFKSEIVTYRKNLFKECAQYPQAIENQKVMIEKFMEKFNVTYDAFNAYLVDHRKYPAGDCTSMVFTVDEQVLFCQYVTESGWWVYNEEETLKVAAALANNETVELGEDRRFAGCFVDPKNGITEQSVFTRASNHRYDIRVSDCLSPRFNDEVETVFGDFYIPL